MGCSLGCRTGMFCWWWWGNQVALHGAQGCRVSCPQDMVKNGGLVPRAGWRGKRSREEMAGRWGKGAAGPCAGLRGNLGLGMGWKERPERPVSASDGLSCTFPSP